MAVNSFYDATHVQACTFRNPAVDSVIPDTDDEFTYYNQAAGNLTLTLPAIAAATRIKGLILVTGTLTFLPAGTDKIHWIDANTGGDIAGTSFFCSEIYAYCELFAATTGIWVVTVAKGNWSLGS